MKAVVSRGAKAILLVLLLLLPAAAAFAQWQVGEQVFNPPMRGGTYFSMRLLDLGPNSPPMPGVPVPGLAVYYLGIFYGTTNAFVYDDRELAGGFGASSDPPMPGEGGGGSASETNAFPYPAYDHGTNLFLIIGSTNNHRGWLCLTNAHYPLLYQLETRPAFGSNSTWEAGELVRPLSGQTVVFFNDVVLTNPPQRLYRAKVFDTNTAALCVAIHDSGLTRNVGLSSTNWNYFVLPEAMKEALRSDGTPFVTIGDSGIRNGILLDNGVPRFPILICLASEAISDDEIAPLTNYVAAGGFLLVGSSSFTRYPNGSNRTDFALADQMGLRCSPGANNWTNEFKFYKRIDHRILSHIPFGPSSGLIWRMPTSADEISWGTCQEHMTSCGCYGPHQIWMTWTNGARALAWGDEFPYIVTSHYGSGCFIYDAALQPLVGHGGFAPTMYSYLILRRAIEWSFESAQRPVVKLSPWPFQYDAALLVRHDLENYADEVAEVEASACVEYTNGVKGDYYFCTGAITNTIAGFDGIVESLRRAISNYGATVSSHNGGLPNPKAGVCGLNSGDIYEYFHWGPHEALDLTNGLIYASNSVAISFDQIESWLPNQATNPRVWVAPYMNATREDSYRIQEQLDIKITGDQKLTPFPAFTLSTGTDGKRYVLLSEPVSDWFATNGHIAQSLDP